MLQPCLAQDSTVVSKYKDDSTNITFGMYGVDAIVDASTGEVAQGFYDFGIVLPDDALKRDVNEYIGILVGSPQHVIPRFRGPLRLCTLEVVASAPY